jgi:autotransporter-associated beta strand protein
METCLIRSWLGWLAAGWVCGLWNCGAVEVAGGLLVDLNAVDYQTESGKWPQHTPGTGIPGDFLPKGSPTQQTVAGAAAVVFDGDGDYFIGPITTAALHGAGARHSVEVWAYQGNARDQESLVSWGKRWGPDLSFAGFRYGGDPDFGAIARWGRFETGYPVVPLPGRWHHLVFTYDGSRQTLYVDGVAEQTAEVGVFDAHDMLPIHLGAEIRGDLKLEGLFTHFSGALARVRIHAGALDEGQVKRNYEMERKEFAGPVAKPLQQPPMHRFSFDAAAGPAPEGSTVIDSIGGLAAVIRGADASFTGSAVLLPGGASGTAAYVDLPNGLISSRENLSLEFWATQLTPRNWCRILSIGTNSGGEITGPGGNFTGTETLTLFGNVGAAPCNRFARSYGTYPNGGPDRNPAEYADEEYGTTYHQVITYDKVLREWHWYRNSVLMEVIADLDGPTTIPDLNVWLGRSEFSLDANFHGLYHEFRVYNHTLREDEILGNFNAGPDKLNLGGVVAAMNWTVTEPGSHSFANSSRSDHWNTGSGGPHPDGAGSIATFASELSGNQDIDLSEPVTLGSLNIGSRGRGGAFTLRASGRGGFTLDSGSRIPAAVTQLPGSPGNFIYAALDLRSDTEISNQSNSPLLLGGHVRGKGAFIKGGHGPVILTGNGSDHSGEVKIAAGALVLGDSGDSGMLGASHFTITDPGQVIFNRGDAVSLATGFSGTGKILHQGKGPLHLAAEGVIKTRGTIEQADGSGTFTSEGSIDGTISLLTDSTLILAGDSQTRVTDFLSAGRKNGGTLEVRDSASIEILGSGHLNVGDIGSGHSIMRLDGGSVTVRQLFVGKGPDTSGVLLQTGGRLRKTRADGMLDTRIGGAEPGSHRTWGAWRMTGGEFLDDWNLQIGGYGTGVLEVDGGDLRVEGFLGIGRYEDQNKNASRGLVDVKSGGISLLSSERLLLVGEEGVGVLNIRGRGRVTCRNRLIIGAGTIAKPGEGTVNLLTGGTLVTSAITQFNQTEAIGRLNFDGGTLKAGANSGAFLDGIDFAFVRKNGAIIDTSGFDVEIRQPLVPPRGNGVLSIPVVEGGSGYLVAPWVGISGGAGSGATAVAELMDGSVRSITMTHAGNDFLTTPAVTVTGGGAGSGLVLGDPELGPGTGGGLIKTGGGMLTLSGTNTYTGTTTVRKGGLRVTGRIAGDLETAASTSLRGNGGISGSVHIAPGSTISVDPGGVLTLDSDLELRGELAVEPAAGGRIDVAGTLDLTGSGLTIRGGPLPEAGGALIIATYGKLVGRIPAQDLPRGHTIDHHYQGGNRIALLAPAAKHDDDD